MVELVLHDPGRRQPELEPDPTAGGVGALDRDRRRTLHRDEDVVERETALVVDVRLLGAEGDDGVHEHAVLVLVDEDEEPPQDADLRRREPHALRLVHQRRHPLHEADEVVVEGLDLPCLHAQRRVAVLPDPRERDDAARLALERALVLGERRLVLLRPDVLVALVLVIVRRHRAASLASGCATPCRGRRRGRRARATAGRRRRRPPARRGA